KGLADAAFALALGGGVAAVGARIGSDRRDVDEGAGTLFGGSARRDAGAIGMERQLIGAPGADQVDGGVGTLHRGLDAVPILHVASGELNMTEFGQWPQRKGVLRMALGDAHSRAAAEQR